MKILLITSDLKAQQGWGTVAYELWRGLKSNHEVKVLSHISDEQADFNVIETDYAEGYVLKNFLKLKNDLKVAKKVLQNEKFDLIVCNVEPYLPLAYYLKKDLGIKKLVAIGHGTYIYYPFVKNPFKFDSKQFVKHFCLHPLPSFNKYFFKAVDQLIVPSRFTRDKVKEWYNGKINVVNWGVDSQRYHPVSIEKEDAFVFVGTPKERKGIYILLQAFKKVLKDFSQAKLYIVGTEESNCKNYINQLGITDKVVITGRVSHEDKLKYLSESKCHVLPSLNVPGFFEGFGLVHLEANACGIPSIGSLGTANEEVIEQGVNGFLCPQKDVDCLVEKMKLILQDETRFKEMSQQALAYAKEHSWERTIEEVEKFILN